MTGTLSFDQVVFSGGGTRCFWQGGFMNVVRDAVGLDPARITGVSGGALSAACFIADRGRDLLRIMARAFARQDRNFEWHAVADDGAGLTPHQRIYREVVAETLNEAAARDVAEGVSFQVLIGHPPKGGKLSATAATLAYEAELHLVSSPHFNWAEKVGVTSSLVDARDAARAGRLVDLVCAAATIPPLFDLAEWDGQAVIDGGMVDQAPMPEPDRGRTLVLLTRGYRNVPDHPDRVYLAPSDEIPADKIDFTDPEMIRATWDRGEVDGAAFLEQHGLKRKEWEE